MRSQARSAFDSLPLPPSSSSQRKHAIKGLREGAHPQCTGESAAVKLCSRLNAEADPSRARRTGSSCSPQAESSLHRRARSAGCSVHLLWPSAPVLQLRRPATAPRRERSSSARDKGAAPQEDLPLADQRLGTFIDAFPLSYRGDHQRLACSAHLRRVRLVVAVVQLGEYQLFLRCRAFSTSFVILVCSPIPQQTLETWFEQAQAQDDLLTSAAAPVSLAQAQDLSWTLPPLPAAIIPSTPPIERLRTGCSAVQGLSASNGSF